MKTNRRRLRRSLPKRRRLKRNALHYETEVDKTTGLTIQKATSRSGLFDRVEIVYGVSIGVVPLNNLASK